jgi:hypothetical protein
MELCVRKRKRLPDDLQRSVTGLTDAQLDTPYRPGGWTARQVVHHLADSQFLNEYAWHGQHHLEQIDALKKSRAR